MYIGVTIWRPGCCVPGTTTHPGRGAGTCSLLHQAAVWRSWNAFVGQVCQCKLSESLAFTEPQKRHMASHMPNVLALTTLYVFEKISWSTEVLLAGSIFLMVRPHPWCVAAPCCSPHEHGNRSVTAEAGFGPKVGGRYVARAWAKTTNMATPYGRRCFPPVFSLAPLSHTTSVGPVS